MIIFSYLLVTNQLHLFSGLFIKRGHSGKGNPSRLQFPILVIKEVPLLLTRNMHSYFFP